MITEAAKSRERATDNLFWGKEAMRWVLARKNNYYKAAHRKDLGDWIAFMWGTAGTAPDFADGEGIANIIARRNWERKQAEGVGSSGEELVYRLVDALARGTIKRRYGTPRDRKIDIRYQDIIAIIQWNNGRKLWFLSGWKPVAEEI